MVIQCTKKKVNDPESAKYFFPVERAFVSVVVFYIYILQVYNVNKVHSHKKNIKHFAFAKPQNFRVFTKQYS